MAENFLNLLKNINLHVLEFHWMSGDINAKMKWSEVKVRNSKNVEKQVQKRNCEKKQRKK